MGRRTAAKSSAVPVELDIQKILNEQFASRPEAALDLQIAERTLERWLKAGEGPPVTWLRKRQFLSAVPWQSSSEAPAAQVGESGGAPTTPNLVPRDEQSSAADAIEQCLTVADIGGKLRLSDDTVRRLFAHEEGVLRVGHPTLLKGRKYRRRYYSLRIPLSVFLRVRDRLQRPQPGPEPRQSRRKSA
jgi:hypothetical protein